MVAPQVVSRLDVLDVLEALCELAALSELDAPCELGLLGAGGLNECHDSGALDEHETAHSSVLRQRQSGDLNGQVSSLLDGQCPAVVRYREKQVAWSPV